MNTSIACSARVAMDADVAFTTLFIVLVNVVPSPLVYVIVASTTEAVTNKLPVSIALAGMLLLYIVPSTRVNVKSLLPVSKDEVSKYEPVS